MSNSICSIEEIKGVAVSLEISMVVKGTIGEKFVEKIDVCSACGGFLCY